MAVSDRGGSLKLQHAGHMTPTVFPAACNSGPASQGLELALERGNQCKLLTKAVGSEIATINNKIVYDHLNFPKIVFLAPRFQTSRKPRKEEGSEAPASCQRLGGRPLARTQLPVSYQ